MAIVVEEEISKTSYLSLAIWVGLLILVVIAVYYVFFATPPSGVIASDVRFTNANIISRITLNSNAILSGQAFSSLKMNVTLPPVETYMTPDNLGRLNPFLPPQ
jgi:hypothetical protein